MNFKEKIWLEGPAVEEGDCDLRVLVHFWYRAIKKSSPWSWLWLRRGSGTGCISTSLSGVHAPSSWAASCRASVEVLPDEVITMKQHNHANLKFYFELVVSSGGQVDSQRKTMYIGSQMFWQTSPPAIWIFWMSVASRDYPSAHPHVCRGPPAALCFAGRPTCSQPSALLLVAVW